MKRREFITLLGSVPVCSLTARAQQTDQVRRVGVLMNVPPEHPEGQPFVAAFRQALQRLGWTEGRNIRIDIRWGENDVERDRKYAAELVALTPDVVLAAGTLSVTALQRVSRTLPIVFVDVSDPVGAGLVERMDRPGGSTTGFMIFEYSLSAKWIELLKQVAPNVRRAAVIRNAANPAGIAQFGAIRTTASSLGVDVSPIDIR
jgi:putative ABC transport system substrate-binding protein